MPPTITVGVSQEGAVFRAYWDGQVYRLNVSVTFGLIYSTGQQMQFSLQNVPIDHAATHWSNIMLTDDYRILGNPAHKNHLRTEHLQELHEYIFNALKYADPDDLIELKRQADRDSVESEIEEELKKYRAWLRQLKRATTDKEISDIRDEMNERWRDC